MPTAQGPSAAVGRGGVARCYNVGVPRAWLGVLGERDFRLFFTGYLVSLVGGEMVPVAVVFAILDQGGSATEVGFVLAAQTVPLAVLLLVGGVVADRLPRRALMIGADVVRAASQGTLAALLLLGRPVLWEYMVLLGVVSAGWAFFSPAMTGLIPQLTSAARLQQANSWSGLAGSVAQIAGPAAGGALVAVVSPGWAIAADAVSYLISASCLAMVSAPLTRVIRDSSSSFFCDLRLGWQEFRSRTWLWLVTAQSALRWLLVMGMFTVLGAVVAKADLGGAGAWGAILAASGAGAVVGGLVLLRLEPRRPLAVAVAATLLFVAPLALLAVHAPAEIVAAGAFVGGGGLAVFSTLWQTTLQREVAPEMLSRVSAYEWLGTVASAPVGYAIVGPLARVLGVPGTLWLSVGVLVAITVPGLVMPSVTGLRASHPDNRPPAYTP